MDNQNRVPDERKVHLPPRGQTSPYEMLEVGGDFARSDPKSAHAAAGDGSFESYLPESCWLCYTKSIALSEAMAQEEEAKD